MESDGAYIRLSLDVDQPVELDEFVAAFTSLASEYERHMRVTDPGLNSTATMYVKQVREGSIIAILMPVVDAVM